MIKQQRRGREVKKNIRLMHMIFLKKMSYLYKNNNKTIIYIKSGSIRFLRFLIFPNRNRNRLKRFGSVFVPVLTFLVNAVFYGFFCHGSIRFSGSAVFMPTPKRTTLALESF